MRSWQAELHVPSRMVVTWLDRAARTGEPGSGRSCAPGQALARAVTAWADEMLCADDDHTRIFLMGGYLGTADIVDHLTARSGVAARRDPHARALRARHRALSVAALRPIGDPRPRWSALEASGPSLHSAP